MKQYTITSISPVHYLGKQSITKCGHAVYAGGVLIENTTTDKFKITCKNCLKR